MPEDAINISFNLPVVFLQIKVNIITISHKTKAEEIYILPYMICIYIKLVLYVHYIEHKYAYLKNRYASTWTLVKPKEELTGMIFNLIPAFQKGFNTVADI